MKAPRTSRNSRPPRHPKPTTTQLPFVVHGRVAFKIARRLLRGVFWPAGGKTMYDIVKVVLRYKAIPLAAIALLLVTAAPLIYVAQQHVKARRFEIGSLDHNYLVDKAQFSLPVAMDGPFRYEDDSVEVIDFYARLTSRHAELELPYHALHSPLRLFVRCHRFGLSGEVHLEVNGQPLDTFVFTETSYPWGGIRAVIPERIAEAGPLRILLRTEGGTTPPAHLSEKMGIGLDYIDVSPMSEGATMRPPFGDYVSLYVFLLFALAFALISGLGLFRSAWLLAALVCAAALLTALFPVEAPKALSRLWIVFPFATLVYFVTGKSAFVSHLVAVAALAHSVLVFFPNHLPPDVPLHGIQVSWLSEVDFTYSGLTDYARTLSRSITSDAVLMETDTIHVPDDANAFAAPYPPFFYMLAYGASQTHDDMRFVIEVLAVGFGCLMLVLTYFLARAFWRDELAARMVAVVFALEISIWHHASRGHGPGLFGGFFVLLFLLYVSRERKSWLGLAGVTLVVALSYTVAFVQISVFMAFFVVLTAWQDRPTALRFASGFALGIAGAVAVFYAPYLFGGGGAALERAADYKAPSSFFFLRNQLRDTVRLLQNGHAAYVLLSLVGLSIVDRWNLSAHHRRVLWAALATYVTILVLKDPVFLPRVFLHAKEDVFYAPFACMLLALPLTSLWRNRSYRPLTFAVLAILVLLSVRDKAFNADTLYPQPIAVD